MQVQTPIGKENVRFDTPTGKTPKTGLRTQKTPFRTVQTPLKNATKTPAQKPLKTPLNIQKSLILGEKTNKIDTPRHATPLLKTVLKKKDPRTATKKKLTVYQDQKETIEYCPPPAVEKRILL